MVCNLTVGFFILLGSIVLVRSNSPKHCIIRVRHSSLANLRRNLAQRQTLSRQDAYAMEQALPWIIACRGGPLFFGKACAAGASHCRRRVGCATTSKSLTKNFENHVPVFDVITDVPMSDTHTLQIAGHIYLSRRRPF